MWKHLEKHRHRYSLALFGTGLVWLTAGLLSGGRLAEHLALLAAFSAIAMVAAFYFVSGVPGLFQGLTFLGLAAGCLATALLPNILPLERFAVTPDFTFATAVILFILLAFLLRLPRRARAWALRLTAPESLAARRHEDQYETAEILTVEPAADRFADDPDGIAAAVMVDCLAAPAQPAEGAAPPEQPEGGASMPDEKPEPEQPAEGAAAPEQPEGGASVPHEKAESEQPDADRPKATPYRQVSQYKQALLDSFRSWSLANALPAMRWVRGILALLLAIGGIACLYLASVQRQPGVDFFQSSRFSLLFLGIAALVYATGIVGLGFLRGLALPGLAAVTFYSLLGIIRIERALAQRPLLLRAAVIVIFLALYSLLVYLLVRGFRQRHDLFNWIYQLESRIIGVDIALKDLLPIEGYSERIDAELELDADLDEDRMRQKALDVSDWYQHRLNVRKILPVGFQLDPETRRLTLHAYCRADQAADDVHFCERILSLQGLLARVMRQSDLEWSVYREQLFPDDMTLHEIINMQQLDMLEEQGVDLQAIHPIRLELRFPDCERRAAAQAQLAAAGYPAVADESFDSRELSERDSMPDFCLAFIELNTRLGLERINTITSTVVCLIAPWSGDLFGWELIAPTDAGPLDDLPGNPQM